MAKAKIAALYREAKRQARLAKSRKNRVVTGTPDDNIHVRTDAEERIRERDRLAALDDRTPAQVWLNDPPFWRSALQARR